MDNSKNKSSGDPLSRLERLQSPTSSPMASMPASKRLVRWVALLFISLFLLLTIHTAWPVYTPSPVPGVCTNQGSPPGSPYHLQGVPPSQSASNSTTKPPSPGEKPLQIMVLTRYRSGSSFVGDLFSHHPDVYYIFEPLWLLSKFNIKRNGPTSASLLARLYQCDFQQIYNSWDKLLGIPGKWERVFCTQGNPDDFGETYRRLCTGKAPHLPTTTATICKSFKHTVIKTIRVLDGNIVGILLANNVKVIHLVRDPRGQMSSILKLHKAGLQSLVDFRGRAVGICNDITKMLDTVERILRDNPTYRENYILVRYEDMALSPEVMTERMYRFAGLDFRDEVREWIKNSTVRTSKRKVGLDAYSTVRNSTSVVRAWTQRLSFSQVMAVQEVCDKVLWRLGYGLMLSQEDLTNKNPILKFSKDYFLTQRYLQREQ